MRTLKFHDPIGYLESCSNRMLHKLQLNIWPTHKILNEGSVQTALVDTGCVVTAISTKFAKSIGLKIYKSNKLTVVGINGETLNANYAKINISFNSGNEKFKILDLPVYVIDGMLGNIIIGQSLLEHFNIRLNQGSLILAQP